MKAYVLAAACIALSFGSVQAQTRVDPDKCIAEIGALDTNGDGYVDGREFARYGQIETNVDTDHDGWISAEERTVACRRGVFRSLQKNAP